MFPILPEDVIDAARAAFSDANDRVSHLLTRQPAMHEEGLDFHLVSKLDEFGAQILKSGTALAIETHWLGGRRHWGRWEISDIAVVIAVRVQGGLVARKVALLQTKRLYSKEISVEHIDRSDYEIGVARLIDRTDKMMPLFKQRKFSFTDKCVYGAMSSGSEQVQRIDDYVDERGIPVYYALYNPACVPSSGLHPEIGGIKPLEDNEVGCRVLKREEVNDILGGMSVGSTPSFAAMKNPERKSSFDPFAVHGWRLETFVADEVMRCREGRLFEDAQDEILASLLYRRSAPITAAIVMTVDLPESEVVYE
ncbi:hypothetical protein U1701_08805 [Sphingomonas sp. PB2P19]|uniref:hypothetical protein n=1 Tax=Sphingomonas rhamnosi TaxID=3096156 RepID=UPI002FC6DA47